MENFRISEFAICSLSQLDITGVEDLVVEGEDDEWANSISVGITDSSSIVDNLDHFASEAAEGLTVKVHLQRSPRSENDSTPNPSFLKADKCVSKSGDQELCDNFIGCNDVGPKRLKDLYDRCIHENIGHLGKCNDEETLYGTSEEYSKYLQCLLHGLPQKSSLSDEEQKLFNVNYHKCVYKYGGKCFKEYGNQS
ncbi:uncharacterized protein TNIN_186271 [Trichonephila inaurata madagascariensis]|uniref:Uncharacterized protein n=1 Tax=Trichonephila inaurata madagascariensis TaxID=2747483 RepID=A0A8X6Y565_9ARAC|nr:uncharacterized protein TNIN_186271 [Trichonephila inaurata madagascariensis]